MGKYVYALIPFGDDGLYEQDIREALADIFDIGVNVLGCKGGRVANAFIASGLAREFELQNAVYIAGKSATDLVNYMLPFLGIVEAAEPQVRLEKTPEYWLGYMLGYYQLKTGHRYAEMFKRFSYEELLGMYWPLHEADETKFLEVLEQKWSDAFKETHLAQFRAREGLSQAELAAQSHVSLRSIQMYEQGNKNINRASGETLYRLSCVLGCSMEDLLEL